MVRRIFAAMGAAALAMMIASMGVGPAIGAGRAKLAVPGGILKGSAVTSGRAFYRSSLPENTLAGIRLGRDAKEILSRWGNPTRITVGSVQGQGAQGAPPTSPGLAYAPPEMNPYASLAAGLTSAGGMLGQQNPPMMPGGLPGLPGLMPPGFGGPMENLPSLQPGGGVSAALSAEEVTWTYDLPNGVTLEFIITDGVITQITTGGRGPWKLSTTQTGLGLGDSYKLVLWVCGYPESQQYAGRFLRVSYVNRNRALYTFMNNRLVGITIAMVPSEITLK